MPYLVWQTTAHVSGLKTDTFPKEHPNSPKQNEKLVEELIRWIEYSRSRRFLDR